MKLTGSFLWRAAAWALLATCGQMGHAAGFEQSDGEAARAIKTGNVADIKRIFADPKRVGPIESNIFVLQDVYMLAVGSGSVPLLQYLDSRSWLARLKAAPNIDMGSIVLVAAMQGRIAVLDYLASQKVSLAVADPDRVTPPCMALPVPASSKPSGIFASSDCVPTSGIGRASPSLNSPNTI